MLRAPITLSHLAFDVLWRHDDLGEQHTALTVPSPGATHDERAVIVREVFGQLEQVGLARGGQAHPDVRDTLRLISKAGNEFYGWVADGPTKEPRAVVVAADAREAVLVVREPEVMRLFPVSPTNPAEVLARQLPDVAPGRGPSINVRESDFKGGGGAAQSWAAQREDPDARALRRLMAEPRIGLSKLYTAHRTAHGKHQRAEDFLTVIDMASSGRWLITTQADSAGQRWIIANPGTPQGIAEKLYRLRSTLN